MEKYKYVSWSNEKKKWQSRVEVGGKKYRAGYSHDPEELSIRAEKFKIQKEKEWRQSIIDEQLQGEEWKEIIGFNGKYQISTFGRIKKLIGHTPGIIQNTKSIIILTGIAFYINKIVITHFTNWNIKGNKILHKDGDNDNCCLNNLELISTTEKTSPVYEIILKKDGITFNKKRRMFTSRFYCNGIHYNFDSHDPKIAVEKRDAFKKELYNTYVEEVASQIQEGEEFREVKDTKGTYLVSNKGRVIKDAFPLKKFMRIVENKEGYPVITVVRQNKNKRYAVHQLVAEAFLGHVIDGCRITVDHINFNKKDNSVENLQLLSNRENACKQQRVKKYLPGVFKPRKGLYQARIIIKGEKIKIGSFKTELEAHQAYMREVKKLEF